MASTLRILPLTVIVATCLTGFLLYRFLPSADDSPAGMASTSQTTARPALTVTVQPPETLSLPLSQSANGSIAAWEDAVVGTEVNGVRLTEVRANVGDQVSKGQVLAVFDDDVLQAELQAAQASVAQAKAALTEASLLARRARRLDGTGAMSQHQIDQSLVGEQAARARLDAANATVAQLRVRERQRQVAAPDDGIISSRSATLGSVLNATSTELFRLIRQGRLEWRADVPAHMLGNFTVGMPVIINATSGIQVNGRVRSVAPAVDPRTRQGTVYVDIQETLPHPGLTAGMFATGQFQLGQQDALVVDQQAIVPRDGFNHVFVLEPGETGAADDHATHAEAGTLHRVSQRKVRTGRRLDERVEILDLDTPFSTGAVQIVVQGAGFLNDGDLVRVVPSGLSSPTATQPATVSVSAGKAS